jgi:hypothetical protein
MVKGITTVDDKPVQTLVQVDVVDKNQPYATYQSNAVSGNYLVNLMSGHNYKLTFQLKGFPDQVQMIDATTLTAYLAKNIDIKFSTKKDTVKSDSLLARSDSSKATIADVAKKLGNASKEGLEFKVQIAAYHLSKNYKYDHLKKLGKVEKLELEDGITRFTIGGSFKTLNEALAHKQKVRDAGQKDAFVTAIYQGKRVYLEQLEKLGLIQLDDKKDDKK